MKVLERRNVPTSRRPHVVTSQHRNVGSTIQESTSSNVATSRRCNVTTSARDLPSIIKSTKGSELEDIGRRTNEDTEIQSSSDTDFQEEPVICIVSRFFDNRMILLSLNIYIFVLSMF